MQKSSFFRSYGFKVLDFVFLLIFSAVLTLSILTLNKKGEKEPTLIITSPDGQYIYPLNKDREIPVKGLIGITVVRIKDGKASIKDSPCPNKTCVACTPVSGNFEWIACLPNQVFIRVERSEEENQTETDASTF